VEHKSVQILQHERAAGVAMEVFLSISPDLGSVRQPAMDNPVEHHGKLGGTTIFMKASTDRFSKSVSMWAIIGQRRLRVLR
jgi:hypothetical protein